ncbi:unnamed protein product [Lathyrus sativus]|nr:unnamed protein product [Lathyrus sativus]
MSQQQRPSPAAVFLTKIYDMLDDSQTDDIICWSSNGNSFVVGQQIEFARDLLPKYFKHNNFSSFVRQLNTYGFRKIASDKWEFANENFKRGQRELLPAIKRQKSQSYVAIRPVGVHRSSASNPSPENMSSTSTGSELMERNIQISHLTSENENLKKENEELKSQLALAKKKCDELVALVHDNVNVRDDEINCIIQQGIGGSSHDAARSDDDAAGVGKCKGQEGVKLFGVWVKGGGEGRDKVSIENCDGKRQKRGHEETAGSENKDFNN